VRRCTECSTDISHRHLNAMTCGDACYLRRLYVLRHGPKPRRSCSVCGSDITSKQRTAKTCSDKCKQAAYCKRQVASVGEEAFRIRRNRAIKSWLGRNKDWLRKWTRVHYLANREEILLRNHARRAVLKLDGVGLSVAEWRAVVRKQRGRCAHCSRMVKLTMDHIIPIFHGGAHCAPNIQGLCGPCNSRKQHRIEPGTQATLFDRRPDEEDRCA